MRMTSVVIRDRLSQNIKVQCRYIRLKITKRNFRIKHWRIYKRIYLICSRIDGHKDYPHTSGLCPGRGQSVPMCERVYILYELVHSWPCLGRRRSWCVYDVTFIVSLRFFYLTLQTILPFYFSGFVDVFLCCLGSRLSLKLVLRSLTGLCTFFYKLIFFRSFLL